MKIFLLLIISMLTGCTLASVTLTDTIDDGEIVKTEVTATFWSSKDEKITGKKTADGYEFTINADNEAKEVFESIATGAVKGFVK